MTEQEKLILSDIIAAAKAVKPTVEVALREEPGKEALRQLMPCFDLFRLVMTDNLAAISRMFREDPASVAKAYKATISPSLSFSYSVEAVYSLQKKYKEKLKDTIGQGKTPARLLYISDLHFYHHRLCQQMDHRGFSGYEEMNSHMIRQWNEKVAAKDDVYILGDFSVARGEATNIMLSQLKGKKHLIIGNHDRYLADKAFDRSFFCSVDPYKEIRDNGRKVILSHYPIFCYNGQYSRDKSGKALTYMLYGHTHNTHDEVLVDRFIAQTRQTRVSSRYRPEPEPIPCNMINCFCMFSGYQPMTLNEWIEIDQKRREEMHGTEK